MARKLQMFFRYDEGGGWSETWHFAAVLDPGPLITYMRQFVDLRVNLLTNDAVVERIRIASTFKRDPQIIPFNAYPNNRGLVNEQCNNQDNAVLIRLEAPGVGFNRVFLHGIPDSMVEGGVFTPDPFWDTDFQSLRSFILFAGNWSVVANVDNPQAPIQIVSLEPADPKGIKVTTFPTAPLPSSGQVRIKGATILGYNGVKNIVRAGTQGEPLFWMLGGAKPQQANPISQNTVAVPIVPLTGQPVDMFIEGFTTRRTGRPFGERPGRARTQLSLRP